MISLDETQQRVLGLARPLEPEILPLSAAAGRWAARDIVAKRTQPVRPLSAMDGYAIGAADPGPWTVIGESAAGRPYSGSIGPGQAVRIFTGAALPAGSDAVVIQENIARDGEAASNTGGPVLPGQHVRRAGIDFEAGQLLVRAGERLTPARIALSATAGHGELEVGGRPRVALLATGDELVPPGTDPGHDKLPESNTYMLAALLADYPCNVSLLPIVPDDLDALVSVIDACDADLLITMGGASVGDHDLVRPAFERCGAVLDFWKVAMRPGKPVMAGRLGEKLVLGLPGNPVSAYVTALLFARPLIARLAGASAPFAKPEPVRAGAPLKANDGRTDHIRAAMTAEGAVPVGPSDSSLLAGLSASDLLIVRPPEAPAVQIGDIVPALRMI